jgi:hypothetical protein
MSTDLDALTKRLDGIVAEIDRQISKRTQRFTLEHDDGNGDGEVDASDPTGDDGYDDNPGEDDYLEDGDEDVEDEFDKATINAAQLTNSRTNRPGDLPTSSHTSSSNQHHKFVALTEKLANDKGIPKSQAMSLARQQFPDVYAHYVGSATFKAAPGSFEALVSEELAKGCSTYEQAAQRVVQQYGFRALDSRDMTKREATSVLAEDQLLKRAGTLLEDDPALSRTDALRKARQDHPSLYRRMNR